ncbi:DUF5995 family protein [Geodermatophilus sp. YIM 151500]|uniref:DUF5995 family protein n=1 Tax=Geodermatophilus sp. YIM 151500 TaxID=2984531 RepID=UPI0021E3892F|nr:DUF5995 family protein [Geodermatophilus sp. YIM 151500]MCV2491497.1 DUF5995 family protein [Geodermatophilus sp. YIM 151500]
MAEAVDAVVARMTAALETLTEAGDPARFFLGTYLRITAAVGGALDDGSFEDAEWVAEWDVVFADLYLDALDRHRRDPATVAEPWRRAFGADPALPPEAHVLLGVNAHVNFDQPQSLIRMVPPADVDDAAVLARRHRDHDRIDGVIAAQVAAEDRALQRAGGRRTPLDRVAAPVSRRAVRVFMAEARRKVWANTLALHAARVRGPEAYAERLAALERVSAARVADLLRPGPVLLRLAVRGFGVTLPAA